MYYLLLPNGMKLFCHNLKLAEDTAWRYGRAGLKVEIVLVKFPN